MNSGGVYDGGGGFKNNERDWEGGINEEKARAEGCFTFSWAFLLGKRDT